MLLAWMFTDLLNSTLATWSFTVCVCLLSLLCLSCACVCCVCCLCVCDCCVLCVLCACVCVCLCVAGVGLVCWWCKKNIWYKSSPYTCSYPQAHQTFPLFNCL